MTLDAAYRAVVAGEVAEVLPDRRERARWMRSLRRRGLVKHDNRLGWVPSEEFEEASRG